MEIKRWSADWDDLVMVETINGGYVLESDHIAAMAELREKLNKAIECLKEIKNPVECPACSMDDPPEYVPCYCWEEWNRPEYKAKECLAEISESK